MALSFQNKGVKNFRESTGEVHFDFRDCIMEKTLNLMRILEFETWNME